MWVGMNCTVIPNLVKGYHKPFINYMQFNLPKNIHHGTKKLKISAGLVNHNYLVECRLEYYLIYPLKEAEFHH